MQLSVIIVNYNVKYFLEHCLLSVIKACSGIEAEIFVVDNNSTDGSREYLEPRFPTVKFKWNKENAGFGKANNSVLSEAKGDHILFLNPDTLVPEDCFTKCLSFFASHDDCGALGVRMIDGSGKFLPESKRSLPTSSSTFFKAIGLANAFPTSGVLGKYYAGHLPEKENNKTEVLAGAFMMLSKKAIEITKGFDGDFFMYGEDVDLSFRITKAGMGNYYFAETTIIHFKGESTQKNSPDFIRHFYGAMKLFADKHYVKNKVAKLITHSAIELGKTIAKLRQKKGTQKTDPYTAMNAVIIGTQTDTGTLSTALNKNNINSLQSIEENYPLIINEVIKQRKANTVIFCEGAITNKTIITLLQQLPKNTLSLFHEHGAKSIIGSNDKNTRGIFITIK